MILSGCIFNVVYGLKLGLFTMLVFITYEAILFEELVILFAVVILLLFWKKWRFRLVVEGLLVLLENPVWVWVSDLTGVDNYRFSDFFKFPRYMVFYCDMRFYLYYSIYCMKVEN